MGNGAPHPLLLRQLRKAAIADPSVAPSPSAWAAVLDRINAFYVQSEQDRYLLERSLDLTSIEMQELNRKVARERDQLDEDLLKVVKIQTAIFPRAGAFPGLRLATRSLPLERASGDYFDVQPTDGGCWLGIGDVAGHGLTAGMLAVMLQSVVAALIKSRPGASPAEVVTTVNAVMFENVRGRLELDDHATLTLLSFDASTGVVEYAGAHEEILWWHASERCCERLATPGTWTALTPSVGGVTVTSRIRLAEGDRLVLYTDGIVEPLGASGDRFGVERLCEGVARVADLDVDEACAQLVGDVLEFQVRPQDDATLVVLQRAT